MKLFKLFALSLTVAILSIIIYPATYAYGESNANVYEKLNSYIEAEMQKNNIPGLAIAVLENDSITFTKTYDRKNNNIDESTPFYIGSLAKSFTALAIMQLYEQDMLDIDTPVIDYIPWFSVNDAESTSSITIRHLLNQTSGLNDVNNPEMLRVARTLEEDARKFSNITPYAKPGESFQYFNNNYSLLGLIIEEVSGISYRDYINANIFSPLNMNNSYVPYDSAERDLIAQGYTRFFGLSVPRSQPFNPSTAPSGYIACSITDLSKYLLLQNKSINTDVISSESIDLMQTPVTEIGSIYGMGWIIAESSGQKRIWHGGSNEFFKTEMILLPENNIGIALLINQNNFSSAFLLHNNLNDGIISILLEEPVKRSLPVKTIELIFLFLFVVFIVHNIINQIRLKKWALNLDKKSNFKNILNATLKIVIPAIILVIVFIVMRIVFNRGVIISLMFQMQPDLMIWMATGILFALILSIRKFYYIIKRKYSD